MSWTTYEHFAHLSGVDGEHFSLPPTSYQISKLLFNYIFFFFMYIVRGQCMEALKQDLRSEATFVVLLVLPCGSSSSLPSNGIRVFAIIPTRLEAFIYRYFTDISSSPNLSFSASLPLYMAKAPNNPKPDKKVPTARRWVPIRGRILRGILGQCFSFLCGSCTKRKSHGSD